MLLGRTVLAALAQTIRPAATVRVAAVPMAVLRAVRGVALSAAMAAIIMQGLAAALADLLPHFLLQGLTAAVLAAAILILIILQKR